MQIFKKEFWDMVLEVGVFLAVIGGVIALGGFVVCDIIDKESKQNAIYLENVDWKDVYTVYIVRRSETHVDIFVDEMKDDDEEVTTRHLISVKRSHLNLKVPIEIPVEFK